MNNNLVKNIVAQNRKAKHDYFIEEIYEAGLVLSGTEVKSLRSGKASIIDAHVIDENGDIYITNCYIPEYLQANRFNHYPRRPRKLLLHKKEINKIIGRIKLKGYTAIALSIYFNNKNLAKLELGLAKGKTQYDKRAALKEKEWNREKARIQKNDWS